jgi:hypothetical protein
LAGVGRKGLLFVVFEVINKLNDVGVDQGSVDCDLALEQLDATVLLHEFFGNYFHGLLLETGFVLD